MERRESGREVQQKGEFIPGHNTEFITELAKSAWRSAYSAAGNNDGARAREVRRGVLIKLGDDRAKLETLNSTAARSPSGTLLRVQTFPLIFRQLSSTLENLPILQRMRNWIRLESLLLKTFRPALAPRLSPRNRHGFRV